MKRRSGFQIMKRLIVELKPLAPIMAITISMGVVGFLAAIAIASFGAIAIGAAIGDITFISFTGAMVVICLLYTSPSPRDHLLSRMPSSA